MPEQGGSERVLAGNDARHVLDGDPAVALSHLAAVDPTLGLLIERVGPPQLELLATHSLFEALAQAIVFQQLHGKAASTIFGRVQALCPPERGGLCAELILEIADDDLRGAGLSRQKLLALRDLARRTVDGEIPGLDAIQALDDEAIVKCLTAVRGIGRWTVEMLLMFRLGRPDVLPVDDYGVRKGFASAFGWPELPTPKELATYGARWSPYRTIASWYLWRSAELGPG
jgi:3-methyladenine DNA glycosylase/8-oxoguanine DNA glycosylase